MTTGTDPRARPAWREPMLWLVIALPALVVVAGFVTLALALRGGGADPVASEVRRTAQIQVEDAGVDERAAALELAGLLVRDASTGALTLTLAALQTTSDAQLRLTMLHPVHARDDLSILLTRAGEAWHGRVDPVQHAWNVRLEPLDGRWRLRGRLESSMTQTDLRPLVAH